MFRIRIINKEIHHEEILKSIEKIRTEQIFVMNKQKKCDAFWFFFVCEIHAHTKSSLHTTELADTQILNNVQRSNCFQSYSVSVHKRHTPQNKRKHNNQVDNKHLHRTAPATATITTTTTAQCLLRIILHMIYL